MAAPSDASYKLPLLGVVALAVVGAVFLASVDGGDGPAPPPGEEAPATEEAAAPPSPPPEPAALRDAINRYYVARDLLPPPEDCLLERATALTWLAETARLLQEGRAGSNRPEDRLALERYEEPQPDVETSAEYEFLRAQALLHTGGEADEVDKAFETAQGHCRHWIEPFLVHGRLLLERGKPGPAVGKIRTVRAQADDIPKIRYALATAYHAGGDARRTLAALDELLAQDAEHLMARRLRGSVRLEEGDAAGAAEDLRAYLARRSEDATAQLRLGQALTALEDRAGARAAFCKAKALGADDAAAGCPDE